MLPKILKYHINSANGYNGMSKTAVGHCMMVSWLAGNLSASYEQYLIKAGLLGIPAASEKMFSTLNKPVQEPAMSY